ncbi:MAG: PspC domain-containing protein [Eubacteriaceae bacterium]|nr:PspC domain-containing protein [Eubacteriaceae bacterium]
MGRQLFRSDKDKKLGGVCAGMAEAYHLDITIVRIAAFLLSAVYPPLIIVYFILAVTLPSDEEALDHAPDHDAASYGPDAKEEPAHGILFILLSIGAIIAMAAYTFLGGYSLGISEITSFFLASTGVYIAVNGIINRNDSPSDRISKAAAGIMLLYVSVRRFIFPTLSGAFGTDTVKTSFIYIRPLLIFGLGITLLFPYKKTATKVWTVILLLLVCYAIYSAFRSAGLRFIF